MSSAEPWPEVDATQIWYRIDLERVADQVERYGQQRAKDHAWYLQVDWQRITTAVEELLQRNCLDGLIVGASGLAKLVRPVEWTLSQVNREGLAALVLYPLQISRWQVTDGGHRATAMRTQGVRFVPGMCMRGDVGSGIDASQVYPVRALREQPEGKTDDR